MKQVEDLTPDELLAELGVELEEAPAPSLSARQERILAGFEDIVRFREEHGREPRHGEDLDIFERLYAVRLERIRALPEEDLEVLRAVDRFGLLTQRQADPGAALEGDDLLAELGVASADEDDISRLRYVRPPEDRDTPDEIADRVPCKEFARFALLFDSVQRDLSAGTREVKRFEKDASVNAGDFFILRGNLVYVAEVGEEKMLENGHRDARLRVIYSDKTESNLLQRSLQRSLYKDENGRRITPLHSTPLFGGQIEDEDVATGTVYVLTSESDLPEIAVIRDVVHKIGVTGGSVERRIANAEIDATFLLAPVKVQAQWKLANINPFRLEKLFHQLFAPSQLQVTIHDRFGNPVQPREWFIVPLPVIDEAVERIRDGSITNYVYDPKTCMLKRM